MGGLRRGRLGGGETVREGRTCGGAGLARFGAWQSHVRGRRGGLTLGGGSAPPGWWRETCGGTVVRGEGIVVDGCDGTGRRGVGVAIVLAWDLASQRGLVQEFDDGMEGQVGTQHEPSAVIEGEA